MYVDADVSTDETVTFEYFNFVKDIEINGDWQVHGKSKTDSWNGYVYYCTDLDSTSGGEDCDSVSNENVRVKVNKDTNSHKISKVFISPNNLRNDMSKWWSDVKIDFDIAADMPYVNNYAKIYLDIPSVYDIDTGITNDDWIFYCFPNFKSKCSVSSNKRITLTPLTDVSGVKSVWLIQTLKNPIANITTSTKDTYAFSGFSEWRDKEVTSSIAASGDLKNGMYGVHTPSATDLTTSSGQNVQMTVFPNNKGESGYYNFTFTNTHTAAIQSDQEVWIWFSSKEYDYYVGQVEMRYPGRMDSDDQAMWFIPCHVQIDNSQNYVGGAECYAKRHSVRVILNTDVAVNQDVSITIVGIRNPNVDTLEYTIAVMDRYDPTNVD